MDDLEVRAGADGRCILPLLRWLLGFGGAWRVAPGGFSLPGRAGLRARLPTCRTPWLRPVQPPGGFVVEPADHVLGRSRGGLTTRLHLGCEQVERRYLLTALYSRRGGIVIVYVDEDEPPGGGLG